jgi:hypothetical protein
MRLTFKGFSSFFRLDSRFHFVALSILSCSGWFPFNPTVVFDRTITLTLLFGGKS